LNKIQIVIASTPLQYSIAFIMWIYVKTKIISIRERRSDEKYWNDYYV